MGTGCLTGPWQARENQAANKLEGGAMARATRIEQPSQFIFPATLLSSSLFPLSLLTCVAEASSTIPEPMLTASLPKELG